MQGAADSTGSTTSGTNTADKKLDQLVWKFLPSIDEQGLSNKSNRKKLQGLFNKYLKPEAGGALKNVDVKMAWGSQFKESSQTIPKKDKSSEKNQSTDETNFVMDVIIYYLYYDIVFDKAKYPKNVPIVDLPYEMVEFLIKKV